MAWRLDAVPGHVEKPGRHSRTGAPAWTMRARGAMPDTSANFLRMPRVSVLLPVRDAAPWLASSLASLARQTLADHEVLAVDDGSRDDSGGLLDRAALRDPRIRVRHTPALGLPAALNLALSLARAPWLARHDADDLSHRDRFARQL